MQIQFLYDRTIGYPVMLMYMFSRPLTQWLFTGQYLSLHNGIPQMLILRLNRGHRYHVSIYKIKKIVSKLYIFPLMCAAVNVWITELTLINKNIRSVRNSHVQVYLSIWRKMHYDVTNKNNNFSFEGLDRHYHKY